MKKMFIINGLFIIGISGFIAACASTASIQPGSSGVKITRVPISKNCKLMGQVSVAHDVSNMSASRHSYLLKAEYNELRGQAQKIGANTVLLSPQSGMTDKKHWATKTTHKAEAAHDYSGNAYSCPVS